MATWNDLLGYIRSNYRIESERETFVKLLFSIDGKRSQQVYVAYFRSESGQEWVHIESPIAEIRSANLTPLFNRVENILCGGLAKIGEMLTLRHAVLLEDMSVNEFEIPLHAVCTSADELESSISFQDQY